MTIRSRFGRSALWLCFAAALVLSARSAAAAAQKLIVGINSQTAIYWPTYVAQAKGFFAKNGVEPDIIMVGSPVSGLQQLLGRSVEIANPTLYVAVNGAAHGGDFVLIGCVVSTLPYSMMASKDIKTAADMKGKVVSLGFKGDVLTLLWDDWLRQNGMQPTDVDKIYNAQATNRYAALASGSAQAAQLNAPFDLRAGEEGYHQLVDLGPLSNGYAMSAIAVRPDWLQANGAAARGFLKAQAEAIAWLYEPANKDEAIAILARDTRQDEKIAAATYADYVVRRKPFSRTLDLPQSFIAKTLAGAIEIGDAKAGSTLSSTLVDLSYRPK